MRWGARLGVQATCIGISRDFWFSAAIRLSSLPAHARTFSRRLRQGLFDEACSDLRSSLAAGSSSGDEARALLLEAEAGAAMASCQDPEATGRGETAEVGDSCRLFERRYSWCLARHGALSVSVGGEPIPCWHRWAPVEPWLRTCLNRRATLYVSIALDASSLRPSPPSWYASTGLSSTTVEPAQ